MAHCATSLKKKVVAIDAIFINVVLYAIGGAIIVVFTDVEIEDVGVIVVDYFVADNVLIVVDVVAVVEVFVANVDTVALVVVACFDNEMLTT